MIKDVLTTATAPKSDDVLLLGDVKVTALRDGYFNIPAPFLVSPDGAAMTGAPDPLHLDVNAFLLEGPAGTVLVDAGCGPKLGPTVNQLLPALSRAGVEPAQVDIVLCTHIHPDHTNGLIDAEGAAIFPRARVLVPDRDLRFWLDDAEQHRAPEALAIQFVWARQALAPYVERIEPVTSGRILPGIDALPLPGHTPGHTGYLIDGGAQRLLIWGDVVHDIALQQARPEIGVVADLDRVQAAATRRSIFERAAAEHLLVTGMHMPFPGFGRLKQDRGGFVFEAL